MENGFYTYLLQCSDLTFYIGWTTNIEKRLIKHNKGKGAKYTKGRIPVLLKQYWVHFSKSEAMKHEYELKQLTRTQKEKLI